MASDEGFEEPPLLRLPLELRQRILHFALGITDDSKSLYFTKSMKSDGWNPAVFRVCRSLRDEALEAFYQTNSFTFVIGPHATGISNPLTYPHSVEHSSGTPPLESALPWQYPYIFSNLRHLHLDVYVTCISDDQEDYWTGELNSRLDKLIDLFERGHKLRELHLTVHAYCIVEPPALTPELTAPLDKLAALQIRGELEVELATNDNLSEKIFNDMNLKARLRSGVQ